MAEDERIERHVGSGYAQTETGRIIFSNDVAQRYASDSADESSNDVQPSANWHPISEKPPKGKKALAPTEEAPRGEDLKIKWGYAEWSFSGAASVWGLVMFFPDVYWYEFEVFTSNIYLQLDHLSHWMSGMGHTAEAFPYSGLYNYLDLETFPDPRPQLDSVPDEPETASEHFQFTLGDDAEATYYNPAMGYDTRWDWLSAGGLYTNISEHSMPDYHITGPMYPESQDQGEIVGGRLYFLYPRPPHNTWHGYGDEDYELTAEGDVWENFATDVDLYFDYYDEMDDCVEIEATRVAFEDAGGSDSEWADIGTFDYYLKFEHESQSIEDPENPGIFNEHYYLRLILDSNLHILAAETAPDERTVEAKTTFEFHTIDIPIKGYVRYEDFTDYPTSSPEPREEIPENGNLTFNRTINLRGRWINGTAYFSYYYTGTEYPAGLNTAPRPDITFCVALPGNEEMRTIPVVTVPVNYESSHEEEVRDYDYLLFKKGANALSFLEHYPLRRGGWYGYADGGSRKSLFFSEEAFDSTMHYVDQYRDLYCVRAQYIDWLTAGDFATTVEGGKHKGKFYQVYPPLIQPLYETDILDNGSSYEYTARGALSIDLIADYATRGMGLETYYGWPIPRLVSLDSYPIALEIELEDENHQMSIRGDFTAVSDWDDPVEYANFRANCIEVVLTGAMFKFAKDPDSTSYQFSGYAWLYKELWYERSLGGGAYKCFYRHVTTQGNREIRIYPEKGTYLIEEP